MIVLLLPEAPPEAAGAVEGLLARAGATTRRVVSSERIAVEVVGPHAPLPRELSVCLRALPFVESVLVPAEPTPRVGAAAPTVTVASPLGPFLVGAGALTFAFGPCSVDDEHDLDRIAAAARAAGARLLRGGAYKPRSSPYSFQGVGERGLVTLRRIADAHGLAIVSEATSETSLGAVAEHCELVQLGARSMAVTPLLKAAARCGRPVLLKRGYGSTVEEWLLAAEYLLDAGSPGVILCERGIRSFEPGTRATLDVGGLALARLRTRLPMLADPSHAAGTRVLVRPLALAAVAAGADGLIVECHPDPARARSDGPQALALEDLQPLVHACAAIGAAVRKASEVCSRPWFPTNRSIRQSSASPR
jgi:3-deoxy-7-phosphoheptulonate synthase